MSWPADGLPRYVLVETTGFLNAQVGGRNPSVDNTNAHRTVAILDRAFCHQAVARFRSEDGNGTRGQRVAAAQRRAAARLAELNAQQAGA